MLDIIAIIAYLIIRYYFKGAREISYYIAIILLALTILFTAFGAPSAATSIASFVFLLFTFVTLEMVISFFAKEKQEKLPLVEHNQVKKHQKKKKH